MHIFLTGATGFIGSAVLPELLQGGHQVIGMTRSESGARTLEAVGAEAHRGTLEDLDSLRRGAEKADAVVHTAFDHNFTNYVVNCEKDGRVIQALGEALKGSDRPLLITSVTMLGQSASGGVATEEVCNTDHPAPRALSERAGNVLLDAGLNVSAVRLPQVHDTRRQGLISPLIDIARAKGVSAYIEDGQTTFPAAHVLDVAHLYKLAIEKAQPGARYHAVDEEGVPMRAIAKAIGRGLNLPVVSISAEQADEHFGWMALFAAVDMQASSAITRKILGWSPEGPGLIADLGTTDYTTAKA